MITLAEWEASDYQRLLINEVLDSGRLTYGDKTRRLEKRFAEIHGVKYALFTSSGTAALKIALHALKDKYGWQDGDEVIIPAVTFVATMNVVLMNNLKPVLVDVEPGTINMDPSKLESVISARTVAIMPVHLFGQSADMNSILAVAGTYDLLVVEDSCETMFVNKVRGDIACFSTYLAHLLVTGVGGFITTNDEEMATVMRSMMFHGRDESYLNIDDKPNDISKRFYFPRFGYSDRMTELEAALGLGEIEGWKRMIGARQYNADFIMNSLSNVPEVVFPVRDIEEHAFMFLPILVKDRDQLALHLESKDIQTRLMMPLTTQPVVQPYITQKYPIADMVNETGILIGCHQYLEQKDLEQIVKSIREFYK